MLFFFCVFYDAKNTYREGRKLIYKRLFINVFPIWHIKNVHKKYLTLNIIV